MNPKIALVLAVAALHSIVSTAQESNDSDLYEFETPLITGYYLPVLWEDPYVRQIGRPVVDTFIGRDGKVVRTELMTAEFKEMEDIYMQAATMQEFRPAYAEGEPIEGFYRYAVQSYCFVQSRFKDKELIDKLPSAYFRISDDTMEQLAIFAMLEEQYHFRFDVKIDKQGNITEFEGIGEPSQRMAEAYLNEFARRVKFLPAEKSGQPVNCAMKMAIVISGGRFVDKTKQLLASNIGKSARPMPARPTAGKYTPGKEYLAELSFLETGIVHRMQLITPMSTDEALAAIDAFRMWKLSSSDLNKLRGRAKVYFKFNDNEEVAEMVIVRPGTSLTPPKPKRQQAPVYPGDLRKAGIQGHVVLEFIVDKQGNVQDLKPIASTHLGFTQEGIAAVSKWKFQPAEMNGRAINMRVRQIIPFRIRE